MDTDKYLVCPECKGVNFEMRREATFLYNYKLDTPLTKNWSEKEKELPFLFDYRELLNSKEYLECINCKTRYSHDFKEGSPKIRLTILQKAIRTDNQENPQFLG
ncbi:hypothetical protein DW1_2710 [Proteiniborus sp. DW1]|uniref:hypothetical protein n=1 Tax=Proteiniborus sp. DW1 TaxID=1889883 RepID=UPI00092E0B72|nr:hypothetical protein [Proteiniborus sp. DW1]SCG84270.1 hypothetical protein DW1_2710 [Proteiniborus sp. DW1]